MLQNCCKLLKDDIAVVNVLDGELALPNGRIEIEEHLAFLLSFSDENLYSGPTTGWVCVEATARSLREIISKIYEGERKGLHSLNFGWYRFCLKGFLQVGQENTSI